MFQRRQRGMVDRRRATAGWLVGLAAACALLPALVWACVPGATIGFDRAVYEYRAGETVTVLGRAFAPNTQVTLTLHPPSGPTTTVGHDGVFTNGSGSFQDYFQLAPSAAPGAYIVVAAVSTTDVDGHGRVYQASEAFEVMPPAHYPLPGATRLPVPAPAVGMIFNGTPGNDLIVGTQFADVITCGKGDDVVRAGGGNDRISCGPGKDRIDAGAGDDRASGGSGRDRIAGGPGRDRLAGGSGDDKLRGGAGRDVLLGGSGDDVLRGDAGRDRLLAGPGADLLFRGRGDVLRGGPGRDRQR